MEETRLDNRKRLAYEAATKAAKENSFLYVDYEYGEAVAREDDWATVAKAAVEAYLETMNEEDTAKKLFEKVVEDIKFSAIQWTNWQVYFRKCSVCSACVPLVKIDMRNHENWHRLIEK